MMPNLQHEVSFIGGIIPESGFHFDEASRNPQLPYAPIQTKRQLGPSRIPNSMVVDLNGNKLAYSKVYNTVGKYVSLLSTGHAGSIPMPINVDQ